MLAIAINNVGQAVGYTGGGAGVVPTPNAFLYNGTVQYLTSLIPAGSGLFPIDANGINDSGQIVGDAFGNGPDNQYAYLMTPVPEPSCLAALALGVVGLALRGRRRV